MCWAHFITRQIKCRRLIWKLIMWPRCPTCLTPLLSPRVKLWQGRWWVMFLVVWEGQKGCQVPEADLGCIREQVPFGLSLDGRVNQLIKAPLRWGPSPQLTQGHTCGKKEVACPAGAEGRVLEGKSWSYRQTVSTPWREVRGEVGHGNESEDILTQWV